MCAGNEDSVHAQGIYLDDSRVRLALHGVTPYIVDQYLGDDVFIPAGCAH